MVFKSVWDSPSDATEFAEALEPAAGTHMRAAGHAVAIVAGASPRQAAAVLDVLLGADGAE